MIIRNHQRLELKIYFINLSFERNERINFGFRRIVIGKSALFPFMVIWVKRLRKLPFQLDEISS